MKKILSLLTLLVLTATAWINVFAQETTEAVETEPTTANTEVSVEKDGATEGTETAETTEAVSTDSVTTEGTSKEIILDYTTTDGLISYVPTENFLLKNIQYFYLTLGDDTKQFTNVLGETLEYPFACAEDTDVSWLNYEEYLSVVEGLEDEAKKATCKKEVFLVLTDSETTEVEVKAGDNLFIADQPIESIQVIEPVGDSLNTIYEFTLNSKDVAEEVKAEKVEKPAPKETAKVNTTKTGLKENILIGFAILTMILGVRFFRKID